jgi:hypothetical protein
MHVGAAVVPVPHSAPKFKRASPILILPADDWFLITAPHRMPRTGVR